MSTRERLERLRSEFNRFRLQVQADFRLTWAAMREGDQHVMDSVDEVRGSVVEIRAAVARLGETVERMGKRVDGLRLSVARRTEGLSGRIELIGDRMDQVFGALDVTLGAVIDGQLSHEERFEKIEGRLDALERRQPPAA